jgi:hypothetical protein
MAARFLVGGGTGNWNSNTNWAATSGGASGASFPIAGDTVTLDANSGAANITVNVASACTSIVATAGYTGTLTFNAQLTVSGTITFISGMTIAGTTGPLVANATATLTSGGKTITCPMTFPTAGTFTLADDWTVNGLVSAGASASTNVNISGASRTLTCNGGFRAAAASNAQGCIGSAKLVLAGGTWDQTVSSVFTGNPVDIAGNVTVSGIVGWYENSGVSSAIIRYVSGTVTTTGSTLKLGNSSAELNTSGITWNNVEFIGAGTWTITSTMNVGGTLTFSSISGYPTFSGSAAISTLHVFFTGSSSTLTLNNTGGLVATGTMMLADRATTFAGSSGWTVGTLTNASYTTSRTVTLTFGNTYTVNDYFSNAGTTSTIRQSIVSSSAGNQVDLVVNGATRLYFCDATDIDSSGGNAVNSSGGVLSNATNWTNSTITNIWYMDYEGGSDNNAGDSFALTDTASDGVADGTSIFTSATGGFTGMEGRKINIVTKGGRTIIAVNSDTSVILNALVSAGSGLTWNIGGRRKEAVNFTAANTQGIAGGDTIRVMGSPAPTSLTVDLAWTQLSNAVLYGVSSRTTVLDTSLSWTASANVTATTSTRIIRPGHTQSISLAWSNTFTTGKAAYVATGSPLDLSAYTGLGVWIYQVSGTLMAAGAHSIQLCSDTAGNTVVDDLPLEQIGFPVNTGWYYMYVNKGSALGASIQSIRWNVNTDQAAQTFLLGGIEAFSAPTALPIASIATCESAWTASASVTATVTTAGKVRVNRTQIAVAAGFTTGKAAYFATGTLDLSGYQQVSFWLAQTAGTTLATGGISLRLCSDTIGAVTVNTIAVPALASTQWTKITVDTGGALGASIASIALYVDTDAGAQTFLLSNIIACKASSAADSLTLHSLIGKPGSIGAGGADDETWYPIMSMLGSVIRLDMGFVLNMATAPQGYWGDSEQVEGFKREPIRTTPIANNNIFESSISGTSAAVPLTFSFGWDRTNMSARSLGTSWYSGSGNSASSVGFMIPTDYLVLDGYCATAYANGTSNSFSDSSKVKDGQFVGCTIGINWSSTGSDFRAEGVYLCNNSSYGLNCNGTFVSLTSLDARKINGNASYGINAGSEFDSTWVIDEACGNGNNGLYFTTGEKVVATIGQLRWNGGYGILTSGSGQYLITVTGEVSNNGGSGMAIRSAVTTINFTVIKDNGGASGNSAGFELSGGCDAVAYGDEVSNNNGSSTGAGIQAAAEARFKLFGADISGHDTATVRWVNDASSPPMGEISLVNCTPTDVTRVTVSDYYGGASVTSTCEGGVFGANYTYLGDSVIESQTAVRHSATGVAWKMTQNATNSVSEDFPLVLSLGTYAVEAGERTITAWLRRDNVGQTVGLRCLKGQLPGMTATASAEMTAAIDTWQQVSITISPTVAGVVEIEAYAWGVNGAIAYVDDLDVSGVAVPLDYAFDGHPAASPLVGEAAVFSPVGSIGSSASKVNGNTITGVTVINASAGQLIIMGVATDNEQTTDGPSTLHTALTIDGHGCTKIGEYTNGNGAANAGATVSIWRLIVPSDIANGSAVLSTLNVGKDAKCMAGYVTDWNPTYTLVDDGLEYLANDASDPGSMTVTGVLDTPHLWVRFIAVKQSNTNAGNLTPTAAFTSIPGSGTTGGAATSNMTIRGEFQVGTGTTSDASNPTLISADSANIMAGLAATLPGGSTTAVGTLINGGILSTR